MRAAVAAALEVHEELELVGAAATSQQGLELAVAARPDVVVMDIAVAGGDGVRVVERLVELAPATRILILTRPGQNLVVEAILAGASGYVLKSEASDALIAAIKATAAGDTPLSPASATRLLECVREQARPDGESAGDAIRALLTPRELEVLARLASGRNNHELASELGVSTNTVRNHIASILRKLGLDNRIQAAVQAVRSGIA